MTAAERVAREIFGLCMYPAADEKWRDELWLEKAGPDVRSSFRRLAKWHLRAVAKAKGRTVGYVGVQRRGKWLISANERGGPVAFASKATATFETTDSHDICRLVLVPRRGRK